MDKLKTINYTCPECNMKMQFDPNKIADNCLLKCPTCGKDIKDDLLRAESVCRAYNSKIDLVKNFTNENRHISFS